MTTTRSTSRRPTQPGPPPLTGTVLTARERTERRQAEQARAELRLTRGQRIQAANDAVAAYMRTGGVRDYQAAFNHLQRTRPELFAGMQVPADGVTAGNFNPYHDALGHFTTSQDAGGKADQPADDAGRASHSHHLPGFGVTSVSRHHNHGERLGQRQGADTAEQGNASGAKKYHGEVTKGAFNQSFSTGECLPAIMREAIAQVATVRTTSDEQVPSDVQDSLQAIEYYIRQC